VSTLQVAIVTGGSRGIGKAVALRLAALGYRVLVVGRDADTVAAAVAEIGAAGAGSVSGFVGDVADETTAAGYTDACIERYGTITAFLNNAGYEGTLGPIESQSVADFDRIVAVNLRGAFLGLRSVIPVMKAAGHGRIVNVSSQAGLRGVAGCGAYAASKHGIIGLSRSAALELAGAGVAVNVVCPGPTATSMIARVEHAMAAAGEDPAAIAQHIPSGRYGTRDEIAQALTWLLTESPVHLTGAVVPVDGGMTAA
jgi:NAD(P)-dependent dehydrogenase (short-subunit alcohol dehydrogenase family)